MGPCQGRVGCIGRIVSGYSPSRGETLALICPSPHKVILFRVYIGCIVSGNSPSLPWCNLSQEMAAQPVSPIIYTLG